MNRCFILLIGLFVAGLAHADDAEQWLQRMDEAANRLSYQGDFVFLRGSQMRHLRAMHLVDESGTHVRISAVDGPPAEILAHGGPVAVDHQGRMQLPSGSRDILFTAVLPRRLLALLDLYAATLGKQDRVAGRQTQIVRVQPLDDLRFGYRLWAEQEHGLLLKAVMVDQQGKAVEQFSFSRIDLQPDRQLLAAAIDLDSPIDGAGALFAENSHLPQQADWQVTRIPRGFSLQSMRRYPGEQQLGVNHLLFSDGLATISVFVEPLRANGQSMSQAANIGGVDAVTAVVSRRQVTVMGEVPAAALSLMLNSVKAVNRQLQGTGLGND